MEDTVHFDGHCFEYKFSLIQVRDIPFTNYFQWLLIHITGLLLFRKDFDVERANEEKEVEHNRPHLGPNSKNNAKPEPE